MAYDSFESVSVLHIRTQRELLQQGVPLEKIWAAWALGLKLGSSIKPELVSSIGNTPSPGTRRHLIVMLAGMSERLLLEIMARDDPDEYVRQTACHYLIQTAHHDQPLQDLLRELLLHDDSAIVRHYLLEEGIKGFPKIDRTHLEQLENDSSSDIRQIIFRLTSQQEYVPFLTSLDVEDALSVIEQALVIAARKANVDLSSRLSERLWRIYQQVTETDTARYSAWAHTNRQSLEMDDVQRADMIATRIGQLSQEQAVEFITEITIAWALQHDDAASILYELGYRLYYNS